MTQKLIIIDSGHGGSDSGAMSNGYVEKELNLVVARRVKVLLKEQGIEADMTRESDYTLNETARTNLIKDKYKYCLSIHFNKFNGEAHGVETIHSMYGEKGRQLAEIIANNISNKLSIKLRRVFDREGSRGDYYYMHRLTGSTTTVIVEGMFIDNDNDIDELNIEKLAEGIAIGFMDFYNKYERILEPMPEDKSSAPTKISGVLKRGMKGVRVEGLQHSLNMLGYDCGKVDGDFGISTERAVLAFQDLNKLTVDGVVGNNTFLKMQELQSTDLRKGHRTMYQFGSYINIYQTQTGEKIDIDMGVMGKIEPLSAIAKKYAKDRGKEVVCATNAQFFNFDGSSEGLGLLIDEGLYFSTPDVTFVDFIYWKDGTVSVKNLHGYDAPTLVDLQRNSHFSIGTSYSLMINGKIDIQNTKFFSHYKWKHPRTLLGWRKDGTFVLVAVDGRSSVSAGVNAEESAKIMEMVNCYHAVNMDGGGSTEMIVNGKIVNKPSDKKERGIGTALIVTRG